MGFEHPEQSRATGSQWLIVASSHHQETGAKEKSAEATAKGTLNQIFFGTNTHLKKLNSITVLKMQTIFMGLEHRQMFGLK